MYRLLPFGCTTSNLNRLFEELERSVSPVQRSQSTLFRTDIKDEDDHYLLEAELPGYRKEDIDIDLQDGVLTITANHQESDESKENNDKYICRERRHGSYYRSFEISGVEEDAIHAAYENGVLKLTLPKIVEPELQSRKIAIQ